MGELTRAILDELDSWIFTPCDEVEADRVACIEWVGCELGRRFCDNPFEDPRDIIFQFSVEMYMMYLQSPPWHPMCSRFKMYAEIAEDLLIATDHPTED